MAMEYPALKRRLVNIYRARARRYDFTANLYYLIGYREWRYRKQPIAALDPHPGDTIVELGCGTGLNFELLQERIGPAGLLIGVDLTEAMLEKTRKRVTEKGNVKLVHGDALEYVYLTDVDGVISTFALSLIPRCDLVIQRAATALTSGGGLALLELQIPDNWPGWLVNVALASVRPFALTEEWLERRPWQTIRQEMKENLVDFNLIQRYLSTTYIVAGRKP